MSDKYDELYRLAENATQGEWCRGANCTLISGIDADNLKIIGSAFDPRNLEYIVATNPQAVMALIDELRKAEARVNKLESQLGAEQSQSLKILNQAGRYRAQLDKARKLQRYRNSYISGVEMRKASNGDWINANELDMVLEKE